jgi:hypothetical protein
MTQHPPMTQPPTETDMREPRALIGTDQLAAALGQPDLRIYDCTTYLDPTPPGSDDPYIAVPGRKTSISSCSTSSATTT